MPEIITHQTKIFYQTTNLSEFEIRINEWLESLNDVIKVININHTFDDENNSVILIHYTK